MTALIRQDIAEARALAETFEDLAPGQARLVDWTAAEYHGDRLCTSRSELEWLREGPAIYRATKDGQIKTKPTKAMMLGTWLHMKVLEPSEWAERLAPPKPYKPPKPSKPAHAKGKAKRDSDEYRAYAAWVSDCEQWEKDCASDLERWEASRRADSIVLDDDQAERLRGMVEGLRKNDDAREWLLEWRGEAEQAIVWRHAETGLLVRLKPDRIIEAEGNTLLVPDLKSTDDPEELAFEWTIRQFGYHRQAALYTDGIQALYPGEKVDFRFVVVRNKPPYEAATYQPSPETIAAGRRQYTAALVELKRRLESNDWRADWQKECRVVGLPTPYAYEEP